MTNPTDPAEVETPPAHKRYATVNDVFRVLAVARNDEVAYAQLLKLNPSRDVIRRVVDTLAEDGKENFVVRRFVLAQGWHALRKERGIPAPRAGDVRVYTVLKANVGGAFLRIPVGALGLGKGEKTKVTYSQDRVVIERSVPPTT